MSNNNFIVSVGQRRDDRDRDSLKVVESLNAQYREFILTKKTNNDELKCQIMEMRKELDIMRAHQTDHSLDFLNLTVHLRSQEQSNIYNRINLSQLVSALDVIDATKIYKFQTDNDKFCDKFANLKTFDTQMRAHLVVVKQDVKDTIKSKCDLTRSKLLEKLEQQRVRVLNAGQKNLEAQEENKRLKKIIVEKEQMIHGVVLQRGETELKNTETSQKKQLLKSKLKIIKQKIADFQVSDEKRNSDTHQLLNVWENNLTISKSLMASSQTQRDQLERLLKVGRNETEKQHECISLATKTVESSRKMLKELELEFDDATQQMNLLFENEKQKIECNTEVELENLRQKHEINLADKRILFNDEIKNFKVVNDEKVAEILQTKLKELKEKFDYLTKSLNNESEKKIANVELLLWGDIAKLNADNEEKIKQVKLDSEEKTKKRLHGFQMKQEQMELAIKNEIDESNERKLKILNDDFAKFKLKMEAEMCVKLAAEKENADVEESKLQLLMEQNSKLLREYEDAHNSSTTIIQPFGSKLQAVLAEIVQLKNKQTELYTREIELNLNMVKNERGLKIKNLRNELIIAKEEFQTQNQLKTKNDQTRAGKANDMVEIRENVGKLRDKVKTANEKLQRYGNHLKKIKLTVQALLHKHDGGLTTINDEAIKLPPLRKNDGVEFKIPEKKRKRLRKTMNPLQKRSAQPSTSSDSDENSKRAWMINTLNHQVKMEPTIMSNAEIEYINLISSED